MNLLSLVFINLRRNTLRTVLTFLSVMTALVLFCAREGVLDTLQVSIKVGSETRLVVRNKTSLIFPLPVAYRDRLAATDGVKRVGYSNWSGAADPNDTRGFCAQFAGDPEYFGIYAKDITMVEVSPPL